MPNYDYVKSELSVDGTNHGAATIWEDTKKCLEMTYFTGPPNDFLHFPSVGQSCEQLKQLAVETILEVRRIVKYGPTNNKMVDNGFIFDTSEDAEELAYSLNLAVEGMWDYLKEKKPSSAKYRPLWNAATYAAACRHIGAGVCAAISWVTMGVITQKASNLLACVYFNEGYDHSYVLIRKINTPWFVVDPWVRQPAVCTWSDNYFGANEGNTHYFKIISPVQEPLGQPIEPSLIEEAHNQAREIGLKKPHKRKIYIQKTNVKEEKKLMYKPVCGAKQWGDKVK